MTVWAGKCYLMRAGSARYCSKQVYGILLFISGTSRPFLRSLLSLWHDLRTSGKEKGLAPLWSGP